jgi:hypothetical protein
MCVVHLLLDLYIGLMSFALPVRLSIQPTTMGTAATRQRA